MKTHIVPLKYFITRCTSTFSDEEQDSLLDTAEKIATYECFFRLFEQVNQSLMVFGIQIEDSSMRSHPSFSQGAMQSLLLMMCPHLHNHKFKVVTSDISIVKIILILANFLSGLHGLPCGGVCQEVRRREEKICMNYLR